MKKIISMLLTLCLMVSVTAAFAEGDETSMIGNTEESAATTLVVYFSATGNTKPLAEYAASYLSADLYDIVPAEPYTDADLNYNNNSSRSTIEMGDNAARPAIDGLIESIEQYDTIFIGYPIWWGEAPRIINTFLESFDLSGKTIVPFCTSASSGLGSSARMLQAKYGETSTWLDGKRFSIGTDENTIIEWIDGLELFTEAE
ncbi:MAG: flavodoxin [Eubacteriales bacterium]|nr:flavodoxin [Eubacteriales bacterium]MDD3880788.1 flavodoxin [Eubacteriales bacterium]MDD4511845.1 flavodoxin [Eubacteriales bacterium]